jgi:uncharacterized protein YjiS (DUF1127 family)
MKDVLKRAWGAMVAAQQRRAMHQVLSHLDARTLKDIGLESHAGDLPRDRLAWRADLSFGGLR